MPTHVFALLAAILAEVTGTMALQASAQFTKLVPSAIVVAAYLLSFYLLSLALKVIPVGVAYAIWAGLGVVLVTAMGRIIFGQRIDLAGMAGIGLIVAGVVVLQLFSQTSTHG